MAVILVTGSAGLIGAETVRQFSAQGHTVVGIDNDMRAYFFGETASTRPMAERLIAEADNYIHHNLDIRDATGLTRIFEEYNSDILAVVHTAAKGCEDSTSQRVSCSTNGNSFGRSPYTLLVLVRMKTALGA